MTTVVWEKCLLSLQQELSTQQYNTWIRPLKLDPQLSSVESNEFCLLAPNRFILDWVSAKFLNRIKELVTYFFSAEQLPQPRVVSVKVSADLQSNFQSYRSAQKKTAAHPINVNTATSVPKPSEPDFSTDESLYSSAPKLTDAEMITTVNPATDNMASFGGITSNTLSGTHTSPYKPTMDLNNDMHSADANKANSTGSINSIDELDSRPNDVVGHSTEAMTPPIEADNSSRHSLSTINSPEGGLTHRSSLNKAFTFESFVEGKSNQMGLAAAQQVVENPGGSYNPLFIYGGVGLGKTHLMHAVGNEMAKRNPNAKIVYLHSERFVADMVKALQLNAINDFKRYYRSVDALLIDDIQFFAGKDRSQEEFFHTFNALLEGNQQIILTCDRYPKVINNLEERLKSRFGWGLTIEVEPPELETRAAILLKRAQEINVDLSYDAAFFIAQRIRSNVRELEGALKRVIANATFTQRPITIDLVREALKDLLALQDKQVSVGNIQKVVGEYYKVKVADLLSKRRSRSVARPRQVAMSLAKELTNHSLPEIGDAFGGRDHTTVLHACRKIKELSDIDNDIQQDLKNLQRLLTT